MRLSSFALTVSMIAFAGSAFAQKAADAPVTRAELPALVKEAILNDPEMLMQAIEKLRNMQEEKSKQDSAKALQESRSAIYGDANIPAEGAAAKDAEVVLVEFFDYHCGYCKRFLPEISRALKEDKKLRVLFMDLPILSPDSRTAAKAAVAVSRIAPNKYFEYHSALMGENVKFDEANLVEIAKKHGIDGEKLKAEMKKPEVEAHLDKVRGLAEKLGINGTPGIIVGDQIVPGAMPYEELKKLLDSNRKK